MSNKKLRRTNIELLDTAKRRRTVLALRKAGATYREIAAAVREKYGDKALPGGWDERYAYKDLMRELEHVRTQVAESATDVLSLELQRLDDIFRKVYTSAKNGHLGAVDRVLRIMDRRAKLLGLDAPSQTRSVNVDLDDLSDDELIRVANGEDPFDVIMSRQNPA